MRRIYDGKITLYHHFQSPVVLGEVSQMEQSYVNCENPEVVYQKSPDGKLKLVANMNVKKELADCPDIVRKFENDEYNMTKKDGSKSSGLLNQILVRIK